MPDNKNRLFSKKVTIDILAKLKFLEKIDETASEKLQIKVKEILDRTQNTSASFINAYKNISIATYKILYEKLNELSTLSVFDKTIEPTQKIIEAYGQVIQEVLKEMTVCASKKGAILATKAEINAELKALEPEIMKAANQAAANSAAALLARPGWLALISLGCISNPVTATALGSVFLVAEICKLTNEFFDLDAKKEPTTNLGKAVRSWSIYSDLSEESKKLRINEAVITPRMQK